MIIYSEFSHWKWWFPIVMSVYHPVVPAVPAVPAAWIGKSIPTLSRAPLTMLCCCHGWDCLAHQGGPGFLRKPQSGTLGAQPSLNHLKNGKTTMMLTSHTVIIPDFYHFPRIFGELWGFYATFPKTRSSPGAMAKKRRGRASLEPRHGEGTKNGWWLLENFTATSPMIPIGSMVLLYMVCHGSHQYTPLMLVYVYIYQHHGSYGI